MSSYADSLARPPRTLTEREVALILRITGQHAAGWRDHVIVSIALGTGLREHEILALDIGDVFDEARRRSRTRATTRDLSRARRARRGNAARARSRSQRVDRLEGALLGTAIGDALGLATEGMSARAIERRFGRVERYHVLGNIGLVSDDTELSALVASSLARHPRDLSACVRAFRRSLFLWFLRLPLGIGLATLRACVRIGLGLRRSGVRSAGNGASMRAGIIGVFFREDDARRREWSDAIARVTHTDARGVEGARFVAELAAECSRARLDADRAELVGRALRAISCPPLVDAIERARVLAGEGADTATASDALGNTGFVLHCVPLAAFVFITHGGDAREALVQAVAAGGDTDSNAAIVGAWVGALHGAGGLPAELVERLQAGPFGARHLRALSRALGEAQAGRVVVVPRLAWMLAWLRNVALVPIVLAHAVRVVATRRA